MLERASNVFALKDIPDRRAHKASKDTISALRITSSVINLVWELVRSWTPR